MAVLRGKSILHDRHFLHRRIRERAFLCALVSFGIAEFRAVEPVSSRHGLAAVDAGSELAAAEDRVPVWLHGDKSWLQLEQGFGESDVGAHDGRHFLVVSLANSVCDGRVLSVNFDRGGLDLDALRDGAYFELHVLAHSLAAA